jgi:hypothetical protein
MAGCCFCEITCHPLQNLKETTMEKCLLCFSENVGHTSDPYHPFACHECGAWGESIDDISTPEDSADEYRHGQVRRVLTDDPEDVFVPGWA